MYKAVKVNRKRRKDSEKVPSKVTVWWHGLNCQDRVFCLKAVGASPAQIQALTQREWWALSKWARKRMKKSKISLFKVIPEKVG